MIYDSLWEMPRENDIEQFRLSFCESLTLLWSRCVDEKYVSTSLRCERRF